MNQVEVKRIVAELLPYIRYHRLNPGDRLPSERDLCKRFDASRNAVREALTALEYMRVVERRPNSGIYLQTLARDTSVDAMVMFQDAGVPPLIEEVADFVETRRILEIQSLTLACARRTDADLSHLEAVLRASEAEIASGKPIAELDAAFHLALVEATHNQVFLRLVNSFYLTTRGQRQVFFRDPDQCRRSHADHLALFDALRERDADRAVAVLERHLASVRAFWNSHAADEDGAPGAPASGR
ncbi:MAG: FadR/GntR family transcriptional regulator [Sneathiellaceae bacterium]